MKFKLLYFSIFFILSSLSAKSPYLLNKFKYRFLPPGDSIINKFDTNFIDPLLDKITVRYYGNYKSNMLFYLNKNDFNANYRANSVVKYGFGLGYRWLIFNWAFLSPHHKFKLNSRGNTIAFDSQLNVYGFRYLFDLRIQRYNGYYLNNSDELMSNWLNTKELIRSDIQYSTISGNLRYQINNKGYSFKSSYDQTQFQKRSSKTSFLGMAYGFHRLNSDSAIAILDYQFQQYNFEVFNFGLGGGYSQTLVYKKNYFFSFTPELYYQISWFLGDSKNIETKDSYGSISTVFRCAAGYNSKQYFFGLNGLVGNHPMIAEGEFKLQQIYSNIKLIFANRFNLGSKK